MLVLSEVFGSFCELNFTTYTLNPTMHPTTQTFEERWLLSSVSLSPGRVSKITQVLRCSHIFPFPLFFLVLSSTTIHTYIHIHTHGEQRTTIYPKSYPNSSNLYPNSKPYPEHFSSNNGRAAAHTSAYEYEYSYTTYYRVFAYFLRCVAFCFSSRTKSVRCGGSTADGRLYSSQTAEQEEGLFLHLSYTMPLEVLAGREEASVIPYLSEWFPRRKRSCCVGGIG